MTIRILHTCKPMTVLNTVIYIYVCIRLLVSHCLWRCILHNIRKLSCAELWILLCCQIWWYEIRLSSVAKYNMYIHCIIV